VVVCVRSVSVCGGDGEEDTIEHSAEQERAYTHTRVRERELGEVCVCQVRCVSMCESVEVCLCLGRLRQVSVTERRQIALS
jgi:hypothetical protein